MAEEDKERKRAEKQVKRIRAFYSSIITYVWVNLLLLVVNLIFNPNNLWFWWVSLFWGIALVFQAINTYSIKNRFLGEEWEKKKIDDLIKKKHK